MAQTNKHKKVQKPRITNIDKLTSSYMTGHHYFVKRGREYDNGLIESTRKVDVTASVKKIIIDSLFKFVHKMNIECLFCNETEEDNLQVHQLNPINDQYSYINVTICINCFKGLFYIKE